MTVIANSNACSPTLFAVIWWAVAEQLTRHSVKDNMCVLLIELCRFPHSVLLSRSLYVHFNHDNSLNSFCMLSGYDNASVCGLYWTRYYSLLQNNYVTKDTQKRCYEHVRYAAAVWIGLNRQVVLGEVEGTLTVNIEPDYLNVEQAITLAA